MIPDQQVLEGLGVEGPEEDGAGEEGVVVEAEAVVHRARRLRGKFLLRTKRVRMVSLDLRPDQEAEAEDQDWQGRMVMGIEVDEEDPPEEEDKVRLNKIQAWPYRAQAYKLGDVLRIFTHRAFTSYRTRINLL